MSPEVLKQSSPRVQAALEELKCLIKSRYPEAEFFITDEDDPEGVYLHAVVDVEDTDQVLDLVIDRLLEIEIDEGLPVYVLPTLTPERAAARFASRSKSRDQFVLPKLI